MNLNKLVSNLPDRNALLHQVGLQQEQPRSMMIAGVPTIFALGALAGVAAALLTASQTGAELRSDLRKRFDETLRTVRDRMASNKQYPEPGAQPDPVL